MSVAIPEKKGTGLKSIDTPDLRRQAAVEAFIKMSGDFVDTSDKFKVHKSVNLGLLHMGYDRSAMLHIFDQYAWQTADKGRRREINVVQLLMPPQINVIGNAGTLGENEEEKRGVLSRLFGFFTGKGEENKK